MDIKKALIFYLLLGPTRALCPIRRTTDGNCCVFPFVYQKKQHNACTSEGSKDLWCQTSSINENGQMLGFCDCKLWHLFTFVLAWNANQSPYLNSLTPPGRNTFIVHSFLLPCSYPFIHPFLYSSVPPLLLLFP